MIRFGQRVTLTDGSTPILRDFHPTAGAFVEHDHPVPRAVFTTRNGVREFVADIGLGDRAWVKAPGYTAVRDRDGCKLGMVHESENSAVAASLAAIVLYGDTVGASNHD
jgi:hypothetical protein